TRFDCDWSSDVCSSDLGAADLAGIVAQADADDLKAFWVLVPAEPFLEEIAHAVGDRLRVGGIIEFDDGVHALAVFGIGQADDDEIGRASCRERVESKEV